jgi:hypothetical protein|tara:strand:+ start:823 stop:1455 length:633 start_codon:yes stop_codon:yes gene_type:complete
MKGNIKLTKTIYGTKGALEKLDEEFDEFALKPSNTKEFFNLYQRFFYNLAKSAHQYFLRRSISQAYPEGYRNPLLVEINDLNAQIRQTQQEINNVERHHFFIRNGVILMDEQYQQTTDAELLAGNGNIFYIQSGRKRPIMDYQTYLNLKMRTTKYTGEIDNSDFVNFLDTPTLNYMPEGPPIQTMEDIFITLENINIYPRTFNDNPIRIR